MDEFQKRNGLIKFKIINVNKNLQNHRLTKIYGFIIFNCYTKNWRTYGKFYI